jgi:nitrogen-specific signal transduction histidine kinase
MFQGSPYTTYDEEKSLPAISQDSDRAAILQLQKQLIDKTEQLNSIISNIFEGLMFISKTAIITILNPAAEKILGKKSKDLIATNYFDHFSDTCFGFSLHKSLQIQQCPGTTYVKYPYKGRMEKELDVSSSAVFNKGSIHKGIILLFKDITQVRLAKKKEEQNAKLQELGHIAARVAHEIRNPLGGIEGFASLLCSDLSATHPSAAAMAGYIVEGSKTIKDLIDNLLRSARPLAPQLEEVELHSIALKCTQQLVMETPLASTIHLHPSQAKVLADKTMIASVMLHLLRNALQAASNSKPAIHVHILDSNDMVAILIKDSGKGIPQEHIDRIFTPFFTTKQNGTGLGLYESYRMIEAHGGHITVQSQGLLGTLFTIYLPKKGFLQ